AASVVQTDLEALPSIGAGNVLVTPGSGMSYVIEFTGALGNRAIAPLVGTTSSVRSNGIHSIVTLDGGDGNDTYDIHLIGGRTDSLINVFDSGTADGGGNDFLNVTG